MSKAFVYPGQGAQALGMGSDFWESPLAQEANEVCGFDLIQVMREGPQELLQSTAYCQPALFLHSALVLEAMKAKGLSADASWHLGLSLGEYSALYGAGAMSFSDVMKALVVRGKAMQDACEQVKSGMVSVLGLDEEQIAAVCDQARQGGVLQAANFNSPGQIVVSGDLEALDRSLPLFKEAGARRALPLKVAGAFHSPLMAPAQDALRKVLESCEINDHCAKVISNVTAKPHDPAVVVDALVGQITAPVRWSQSIESLIDSEGVTMFCEWGTGKVLSGLIKRVSKDVQLCSAGSLAELESCSCVAIP
jgi:[acyl-carrier-protein] S-malonyltransferase